MNEKAVVVGIKEKQPTALRFAAQAAVHRDGQLRVVHCLDVSALADLVLPYDTFPPESWWPAGEAIIADARDFVDELSPRPAAVYRLADGRPLETLKEESAGASLAVVGVDSAKGLSALFEGSVTRRLVTQCPVPVAVVPERAWGEPLEGPIVVAIDTWTDASASLRFAFEEASRSDKELHVAHVIPETVMPGSPSPEVNLSKVLAGWSEQFPDVTVIRRFFFDDAEGGCIRASEEASLLILGRSRTHLFGHPVLEEIVRRVHCPCVIVPDEDQTT